MFRLITKDKQHKYTVTRRARGSKSSRYYTWLLSEYSLPDSDGDYMRVRVVADFGKNYKDAKFLAVALVQVFDLT